MAIKREVVARWTPSLSPDVKAQKLRWYSNGKLIKRIVMYARMNRRAWSTDNSNYPILEGDTIQCLVCAVDEVGESEWIEAEVGYQYNKPDPPTDLTLEKLPVYLEVN